MASPLPDPVFLPVVVEVFSLEDVKNLATDGAPRHVVLLHADSLRQAREMVLALQAKGLLVEQQGGHLDGFETGSGEGSGDSDSGDSDSDDTKGGARLDKGGANDSGDHIALDVRHLLSDDDIYAGSERGGVYNGGNYDVAEGWVFANLDGLLLANDLGAILDRMVTDALTPLADDPTDTAALSRLHEFGKAIRRIGKDMPELMGQSPVTVGNYIQNVVRKALKRGSGHGACIEERWGRIFVRVMKLYEDFDIHFIKLHSVNS